MVMVKRAKKQGVTLDLLMVTIFCRGLTLSLLKRLTEKKKFLTTSFPNILQMFVIGYESTNVLLLAPALPKDQVYQAKKLAEVTNAFIIHQLLLNLSNYSFFFSIWRSSGGQQRYQLYKEIITVKQWRLTTSPSSDTTTACDHLSRLLQTCQVDYFD